MNPASLDLADQGGITWEVGLEELPSEWVGEAAWMGLVVKVKICDGSECEKAMSLVADLQVKIDQLEAT